VNNCSVKHLRNFKLNAIYIYIFFAFSDLPKAFPNICEQVMKETESFLSKRDLTSLDEEKSSLLRQQIMNLSDESNNICQLISKFLGASLTVFLNESVKIPSFEIPFFR
jgi:transcription termination factor NusB